MFYTCDNLKSISLGLLAEMPFRVSRGIVAERAKGFYTSAIMKITEKDKARFWKFVNKRGKRDCLDWTGSLMSGYGSFWFSGKNIGSHCFSFLIHKGLIESGKYIMHSCDNRKCVNPSHISQGTPKQNSQDCVNKNRHCAATKPETILRGQDHGRAKLTEVDVLEIRRLYACGYSTRTISKKFPICQKTVQKITGGKLWKNL